ncbi:hypothetical protein ACS0TY_018051 [Phlomoides rotata]
MEKNITGAENSMQQGQHSEGEGGGGAIVNRNPSPPLFNCPRCHSDNTKFCYYNNHSLTQPRYFCRSCRRYWTQGGSLRNIPIGGSCRKSKRGAIRAPPPSVSVSGSNNLSARTQGLSTPIRVPNSKAVIPPPPIGGSFYIGGGSFLSTLAAMRPLSGAQGVAPSSLSGTQGVAPVNLGGGGRSAQIGGNMSVLHGVSLPSLKSPVAQPSMHFCPPQPRLVPPPIPPLLGFGHWSQGFVNGGGSTSSSTATTTTVWNCNAGGGNDQAGSSVFPNQGFNNPSE